jgi:hypothetical protein
MMAVNTFPVETEPVVVAVGPMVATITLVEPVALVQPRFPLGG